MQFLQKWSSNLQSAQSRLTVAENIGLTLNSRISKQEISVFEAELGNFLKLRNSAEKRSLLLWSQLSTDWSVTALLTGVTRHTW